MENQQIKTELIQMQDLLKASEQEKLQLKYEATKKETTIESSVKDERVETRFLTELLKVIGADRD